MILIESQICGQIVATCRPNPFFSSSFPLWFFDCNLKLAWMNRLCSLHCCRRSTYRKVLLDCSKMCFGLLTLLAVVGVDAAPVLRSDISPLPVSLGGIVPICELLQQLLVAHYAGVICHLNQQDIV